MPLVETDDLRKVIGDVSRRRLLRAGAGAATLAITAGVAAGVATNRQRMTGAGWESLFMEEKVHAFLRGRGFDVDVEHFSGLRLLDVEPKKLARLDFVTCPNQSLADRLVANIRDAGPDGGNDSTLHTISTDEMVVLARRDILPILAERHLVVRPKTGDGLRFDVAAYLSTFPGSGRTAPDSPPMAGG